MRKINTAIVGCGVISDVYLSSLQEKFSVIQVTACSDLDEERMKKTAEKYGLEARTYPDILKDEKIELILNLTSPAAHYPLTKQALEHGKHVYSEKTMAAKYEEGKELCLLADQNHVRLGGRAGYISGRRDPDRKIHGGKRGHRQSLKRRSVIIQRLWCVWREPSSPVPKRGIGLIRYGVLLSDRSMQHSGTSKESGSFWKKE